MSIIMSASSRPPPPAFAPQPELAIRELLDHVAVELAHEYVQLLEAT
jgi:hypothetical protein